MMESPGRELHVPRTNRVQKFYAPPFLCPRHSRPLQVFGEYFDQVEEESIRDNFVMVYELLDEMVDFGYPQNTEPVLLKECAHSPPPIGIISLLYIHCFVVPDISFRRV
jgi:hypothetical protein